jgi:hypothetical protein
MVLDPFGTYQLDLQPDQIWRIRVEPTTGIEPVNLILTKDVLYLLSYVGT